MDHLHIKNLLNRLHLSPLSDDDTPNSLLRNLFSNFADDNLPLFSSDDDPDISDDDHRRRSIAIEESKLELEIIRIIRAGNADLQLKANSGQSVAVGDHNICVGFHDDAAGNYRVWEWHGHIMMFDEDDGFNAEYVYGNHFERLPETKLGKEEVDEDEDEVAESWGCCSGLKDLIGDSKVSIDDMKGRILHRNCLLAGSLLQ